MTSLGDIIGFTILSVEVASLGFLAFASVNAPEGYEDPVLGFVNLEEAPDYVPEDIMDLPDLTYVNPGKVYNYEVDGL
jgi:hypothetical protein